MRRLLFTALVLALALGASAQNDSQILSESVSVGYVMIPFTVLGSKGAPITDLHQGEVSLFVDGRPVRSDMFEKSENAPVSFTILLDGSGSMALAGKMDAAHAAIGALLAHRQPGDDFSLFVFDDTAAHELVPFTTDVSKITTALSGVQPWGKTAFFDALSTMPERSRLGKNPSRAVILLSDGIDNASKLSRADLARKLQGVAVPIYPLGLRDPEEERPVAATREALSDLDVMREVASLTGGSLFLGSTPQQIALAVAALEKNLRAQYLIGFAPTGEGAVKYRTISLELAGRVQSVRVRAGYLGTAPPGTVARKTPNERKRS
jgi:Ca-activated chloride channel family protein